MTTTWPGKPGPAPMTPLQAAHARRAAWYDPVAVERALRAWVLGERLTLDHVGRRLSRRERTVVLAALCEIGATANEVAVHLRASGAALTDLTIVTGNPALHRQRVDRAVAYLDRYGARDIVRHRRHPLTSREVDRIMGLEIGRDETAEQGVWFQPFSPRRVQALRERRTAR